MKITAYGVNYTGAHWRRMVDPLDGREVKIVLNGTEKQIVDFLLDNFSYGVDSRINDVQTLVTCLLHAFDDHEDQDEDDEEDSGDSYVRVFDGCGAIVALFDKTGEQLVNLYDIVMSTTEDTIDTCQWIDLGTIDLTNMTQTDNYINTVLYTINQKGQLPTRDIDAPNAFVWTPTPLSNTRP